MDCNRVAHGMLAAVGTLTPSAAPARRPSSKTSVSQSSASQLLAQVLDHALARHLAGEVSRIDVELDDDHLCVRDDGRGLSIAQFISMLGPHAERIELVSSRFGTRRRWLFEQLELLVEGERLGHDPEAETWTNCIRVWPGAWARAHASIDAWAVEQRLRGVHCVRPSLRVSLDGQVFDAPRGPEAWVAAHRCTRALPSQLASQLPIQHIEARRGTTEVELAWAWLPPFGSARCSSYVNLAETVDDGSHVDGLLAGLAKAHGVSLALARERCLAMVSVMSVNPQFSAATRGRLHDPVLERWIAELVERHARDQIRAA